MERNSDNTATHHKGRCLAHGAGWILLTLSLALSGRSAIARDLLFHCSSIITTR
jgi:hypothetical protein